MNGVFLLSVCVFIIMESVKRFIEIERMYKKFIYGSSYALNLVAVKNPLLVIYVSTGGLAVNIIGLIMFSSTHCLS